VQFDLNEKLAIVTGGTRGLGRDIATALVEQGCRVIVCGRNQPDDLSDNVTFKACDIRDADQAQSLVDDTVAEHGGIDILVRQCRLFSGIGCSNGQYQTGCSGYAT